MLYAAISGLGCVQQLPGLAELYVGVPGLRGAVCGMSRGNPKEFEMVNHLESEAPTLEM